MASLHFSFRELTRTSAPYSNDPTPEARENLIVLAQDHLEVIRAPWGPLIVTSGYRGPEVNRHVGGAMRSLHQHGCAADLVPVRASVEAIWRWLPESGLAWDEAIWERRTRPDGTRSEWLHYAIPIPGTTPRRRYWRDHR